MLLKYGECRQSQEARLKEAEEKIASAERERADLGRQKEEAVHQREELARRVREVERELQSERRRTAEAMAAHEHSEVARRLAENRAAASEELARAAEEQTRSAVALAGEAEERALRAQGEVVAAIDAARQAVAEYKDSDEFESDATAAAAGIYLGGFSDCLAQVAEAYPDLDLSRIPLPSEAGEESGDVEVAAPAEEAAERADQGDALPQQVPPAGVTEGAVGHNPIVVDDQPATQEVPTTPSCPDTDTPPGDSHAER